MEGSTQALFTTRRAAAVLLLAAAATLAGCAAADRPADAPLPPRGRMDYDAEATVQMAVAERLDDERRSIAALLAAQRPPRPAPTTRPATVEVPSPQLIPAPSPGGNAGGGMSQGVSAHPLEEALSVVADANGHATRGPTPEGFLNAVHYYDYAPGVRYNAVAAAGYITTIRLRPGERLRSLSASDTAAYDIDTVEEGTGASATTLILVKPKRAGTQSNWVVTTDERTYLVDLYVNAEPNFQSMVAWHYPLDGLRVELARRDEDRLAAEKGGAGTGMNIQAAGGLDLLAAGTDAPATRSDGADATAAGPMGMDLDDLNFGYVLLYQSRGRDGKERDAAPPPWAPLRVFDDGRKTFVQFPPAARHLELPPLFKLDHPEATRADLVNYRRSGDYLVVDGLLVAAELRAGEAPQQVVKIVRGTAADPAAQPAGTDADRALAANDAARPSARGPRTRGPRR